MKPRISLLLALLSLGAPPAPRVDATESSTRAFRIGVERDGIYRIPFESLVEVGLAGSVPSRSLALSNRGRDVPLRVVDGGDGTLDAGDVLFFLGQHLPGEISFFNEHTSVNVFRLTVGGESVRGAVTAAPERVTSGRAVRALRRFESQNVMVRFPADDPQGRGPSAPRHELWYWAALNHSRKPLELALDLPSYAGDPTDIDLRLGLKGWSTAASAMGLGELRDHELVIRAAGARIASAAWDGVDETQVEISGLPPGAVRDGTLHLELKVPRRRVGDDGDLLVDASLLNWIEVSYPTGPLAPGQYLLEVPPGQTIRWAGPVDAIAFAQDGDVVLTKHAERLGHVWVSDSEATFDPVFVEPARETNLASPRPGADYVIIAHPTLREAIEPLAEFHRSRGLEVLVVETTEVYDAFGDGIATPLAIRSFLRHAVETWQPPRLRFVLFVGDASWDARPLSSTTGAVYVPRTLDDRLIRRVGNADRPGYQDQLAPQRRNLVPVWRVAGKEGHYASDAWYGMLDPGDPAPQLAMGRIPTVSAEETRGVVGKILRAARSNDVGPWRRRVFWITNQVPSFQRQMLQSISRTLDLGIESSRHFPDPEEPATAKDQELVRRTFDRGNFAVLFYGHGGRFIWRTGPPDLANNRDLFTLEDLDKLRPTDTPPVVLSMTCFSAPFDHPTADSIGEKLLRLPDRGASAVIAASWRTVPSASHNDRLLRALIEAKTVGEALQNAKARFGNWRFSSQYNLIGDPAMPVRYPEPSLDLTLASGGQEGELIVSAPPRLEGAKLLIDWLDADGVRLSTSETRLDGTAAVATPDLGDGLARVAAVQAYAWDPDSGRDALGVMLTKSSLQ